MDCSFINSSNSFVILGTEIIANPIIAIAASRPRVDFGLLKREDENENENEMKRSENENEMKRSENSIVSRDISVTHGRSCYPYVVHPSMKLERLIPSFKELHDSGV